MTANFVSMIINIIIFEYYFQVEDQNHLVETGMFVTRHFLKLHGHLPHFLWGESMGGAIAVEMHLRMKGEWDGAVFIAPMVKIADEMKPPKIAEITLRKVYVASMNDMSG